MKTVDYSQKVNGMSLSPDYGEDIQEGTREKLEAVLKAFSADSNKIVIITGCEVTVNGNDYSMTAGSAFYNGRIYSVPALPVTTIGGGDTAIWQENKNYTKQAIYGDNQFRDTFYNDELILAQGAPGSGIADHDDVDVLADRMDSFLSLSDKIQAAQDALVAGAPAAMDTLNELADALADDEDFAATMTSALAGKVAKGGDSMSGNLAMGNNKVTGLGAGTAAGDAVNKTQLDGKLTKAGDTMTGALAMGGNKVTGLGDPTAAQEAVTKNHLDATRPVKSVKFDIVDWNMDTAGSFTIDTSGNGFTVDSVVRVTAWIKRDDGANKRNIEQAGSVFYNASLDRVDLFRDASGIFDDANYDSTGGFVRGHVIVEYI